MKIAFIGLGKMGLNMVTRLINDNHDVVVYDKDEKQIAAAKDIGAIPATSIKNIIPQLPPDKHIFWLMLPAGEITDAVLHELTPLIKKHSIIIDGGNSFWKDSQKRSAQLSEIGIAYIDCGTSGGIWGLKNGYCLMCGGSQDACTVCIPVFKSLAADNGYLYCGKSGSGHFTKMVHNAIEYGMMQSIAEGFELLNQSPFDIDKTKTANVWMNGSVIRSWLLELVKNTLDENPELDDIDGFVEDNGEARWAIQSALELEVPLTVISQSLFARFSSRQQESYSMKLLASMRKQFGGHRVKYKK